jgi:hypothetical protein
MMNILCRPYQTEILVIDTVKPNDMPDLLPSLALRVAMPGSESSANKAQLTAFPANQTQSSTSSPRHDAQFVLFIPIPIKHDGNLSPDPPRLPKRSKTAPLCQEDTDSGHPDLTGFERRTGQQPLQMVGHS